MLRIIETIQQLGVKYVIHPNQITTWKKQFWENADTAFGQQGKEDEPQLARQQLDPRSMSPDHTIIYIDNMVINHRQK